MIQTKEQLKECLEMEKKLYRREGTKGMIRNHLVQEHGILIAKYVRLLRKCSYYGNHKKGLISRCILLFYERRRNKLGNRLGFYIGEHVFEKGLMIYHHGCIIVNGSARVGENCQLHGSNCIGNDGKTGDAPVIGNNVDIGFGASVIGKVILADDIKVAAGAVVVKSCMVPGTTLAGVPAVPVKSHKEK